MVWGRRSAPRSHWYYRTAGPPDTAGDRYYDPTRGRKKEDEGLLVELRSTGGQSMAPPSVHPDGERVEWAALGEPAFVPAGELHAAVRAVAAAALLGRR